MRTALFGLALILLAAPSVYAQQTVRPAAYGRTAALGHGRQGDCCEPLPCASPAPAAAPQAAPQGGYFAAPPQTGAVAGESRGVGLNGFAIHLPALTLKLPTIEFPSLYSIRRNPHMMVDAAQAPYIQQAAVAQAAQLPQQTAVTAPAETPREQESPPAPQQTPPTRTRCDLYDPGCASINQQQFEMQLRQREYQIQLLEQQVGQLTALTQQLVDATIEQRRQPSPAVVEYRYTALRRLPEVTADSPSRVRTVEYLQGE